MLGIGAIVTALEEAPIRKRGISALNKPESNAGLFHFPAFGADVLALFAVQRGEKLYEDVVSDVQPEKLYAAAQPETCMHERLRLALRRIKNVRGGVFFCFLLLCLCLFLCRLGGGVA